MAHLQTAGLMPALESAMFRPDVVEAYARRLVAALSSDMGTRAASVQRTIFESQDSQVVEWKAMLESGVEIRLSAAVLTRGLRNGERSKTEKEELRELGIASEEPEPK
jgi:hypothetical protein